MTGTREAEELLLIEEADAWFEYLEATRGQSAARYREVEPWAWARLMQRMRAIKARRAKLRPAAGARLARPGAGFEPTDGGLAERARARIRDGALYSPPRYRNEVEQLPREGAQAEAGAERGGDLRQALARIDLEAVAPARAAAPAAAGSARARAGRRRGRRRPRR